MGRHKKLLKNKNMMKANLVNEVASQPGFPVFQACGHSTGTGLISPGPNGVNLSYFIEWFDSVTGPFPTGNNWSTSSSDWETSGGGSGNLGNYSYDSWNNAGSLSASLPSQNVPSAGDVISPTINGQWQGCLMYVGTSGYYDIPKYFPANITNGNIIKTQVTSGPTFNGGMTSPGNPWDPCTQCMYGAVDPGNPGGEEMAADWEHQHHAGEETPINIGDEELQADWELSHHGKRKPPTNPKGGEEKKLREEVSKMKKLIKF
jgi:hypothetical protein|tara:strand:- start:1494 stop:2276 length:783 start_codon:yes stop_codon:yes gene_type:complete